jgi:hypothetical protein
MSDEEQKPLENEDTPTESTPSTESESDKVKKASKWEVFFPSRADESRNAIYIASFSPIIYFWPSMLVFFGCGLFQKIGMFPPDSAIPGWLAIAIFALNVLVIVQDFDQKKFVILILSVAVFMMTFWIMRMKGLLIPEKYMDWIVGLNPQISTSAFLMFGLTFLFFFIWGMVHPLFDYWRLEHNEFVHFIQPFGRDQSIPRQGSTVAKEVPDVLEFLLTFGGGSLVIKREGRTWARISHIPFLGLRMKAIEKMLSETRVTFRNQ